MMARTRWAQEPDETDPSTLPTLVMGTPLPRLVGTDAQIAAAERIRARKVARVEVLLRNMRCFPEGQRRQGHVLIARLFAIAEASWWLDRTHLDIHALLMAVISPDDL